MINNNTQESVIAFIDFLGYRELIKKIASDDLETLIKGFEIVFSEIPHCDVTLIPDDDEKLKKEIKEQLEFQYLQIGDAILITAPIRSTHSSKAIQVARTVGLVQFLQSQLLVAGPPELKKLCEKEILSHPLLRGAITIGQHYVNGNFVLSKSFIEAYEIESKEVKWPVVILTKSATEPLIQEKNRWGNFINKNLIRDSKNIKYPFVNYLFYLGYSLDENENAENMLMRHKLALEVNLKIAKTKESDRSVFEKIRWLTQYHNYFIQLHKLNTNLLFQDPLLDVNFEKVS